MMKSEIYERKLQQLKGERNSAIKRIESLSEEIQKLKRQTVNVAEAQIILQTVAKQTQGELEYHISEIVSMALESVFDDPYTFQIKFVEKRGKTECEMVFKRDGVEIDPISASGGGAVDIASFALRIALWNLRKPKSLNTIVLDEPFRFLSSDLQPKAGEMLKTLSKKLNIQFIIVTHNKNLIECADILFTVKKKEGQSYVE